MVSKGLRRKTGRISFEDKVDGEKRCFKSKCVLGGSWQRCMPHVPASASAL